MIILLSPSKLMNKTSEYNTPSNVCSESIFNNDARMIINSITECSITEIMKVMKCNENIAKSALSMAYNFNKATEVPAALLFNGIAFNGLNAHSFSTHNASYAQEHLRIGSGVYGILKPYDLIKPHRLDLESKLFINNRQITMQSHWRNKVTESIITDAIKDDGIILNVASNETFKTLDATKIKAKKIKVISVKFVVKSKLGLKTVPTVIAKKARGMLSHFVIMKECKSIESLKCFNMMNMRFYDYDNNNLVYIYEG